MLQEFDVPVVKIHQKWTCDNNPTSIPSFNYRYILRSQSTFQNQNFKNGFFPHNIATIGYKIFEAKTSFGVK